MEELAEMRRCRIACLIHPSLTVLDDSIGCAQWFASRGVGHIVGSDEEYISPARVLPISIYQYNDGCLIIIHSV